MAMGDFVVKNALNSRFFSSKSEDIDNYGTLQYNILGLDGIFRNESVKF